MVVDIARSLTALIDRSWNTRPWSSLASSFMVYTLLSPPAAVLLSTWHKQGVERTNAN